MKKISMQTITLTMAAMLLAIGCMISGCSPTPVKSITTVGEKTDGTIPVFTHSFSEYPSWSVFGVAESQGLINGKRGKQGTLEEKWNVDIVLSQADYDTCLTQFSSSTVDSSCLTTLDSLAPSIGRSAVVVLPTSTSDGADACIVVNSAITNGRDDFVLNELKKIPVYGLEKSVSQYAFERVIATRGQNPKDYQFKNMDPAAAAQAMQTNQPSVNAIMVWNPFVLQTLRTRTDTKVIFSSDVLKEEIIDAVVVGKDALARDGGDRFAACLIDSYYQVCNAINDPATSDKTTVALGEKFCNLPLEDMRLCLKQTKFYDSPAKAKTLFENPKYQNEIMPKVVEFCERHEIVPSNSGKRFGFEDSSAQLNFTTKYIDLVLAK
jgi:hypothetical protein